MSVPLPGWFAAQQERPIADQLDDGDPRAADRHPLRATGCRTAGCARSSSSGSKPRPQAEKDGVSQDALDAGLRIRRPARLRRRGQARHVPVPHLLRARRRPRCSSVLDGPARLPRGEPGRLRGGDQPGLRDAGGLRRARCRTRASATSCTAARSSGEWPTLREALDRGWRVLFLAERRRARALVPPRPIEQHRRGHALTPSRGATPLIDPARLAATCEPNRGPEDAPLFLVNHWVSDRPDCRDRQTPTKVNAYERAAAPHARVRARPRATCRTWWR